MTLTLLALLVSAAPVTLSAPVKQEVGLCSQAACTGTAEVRVCKCLPVQEGLKPGITVDRPGGAHLEWDAVAWQDTVDDFSVQLVDLDGDGAPELVIANRAIEATGMGVRTWAISIVDGKRLEATHSLSQDFGPDAVSATSVLLTEWERQGPALVFAGREYSYGAGRLEPTRAPVLRRTLNPPFEEERDAVRAAAIDRLLTPRKFLSHASTLKGLDQAPKSSTDALVLGVSRDDDVLGVHLELKQISMLSFSSDLQAEHVLRLASAKDHRLYPLGYVPADAELWLSGRKVKLEFANDLPVGALWLEPASVQPVAQPKDVVGAKGQPGDPRRAGQHPQ
jgi:hypothetical protein